MALPRYIALCGNPQSGKSAVQDLLYKHFWFAPVDDGEVLRQFAIKYLGLSQDDVYSQAGKARTTEILGRTWQNREILGEFGHQLEVMFGEHVMPFIATRNLSDDRRYSFGSVRKNQAAFFNANGGITIEIVRPGAGPSPFAFDKFNRSMVSHVIYNNGDMADLERTVVELINSLATDE